MAGKGSCRKWTRSASRSSILLPGQLRAATVRAVQTGEPVPPARGLGRIIFLNGAAAAGKSTLAKAVQATLDEPFLHISSDQLVDAGVLPQRRDDVGPFDWWRQMRPR